MIITRFITSRGVRTFHKGFKLVKLIKGEEKSFCTRVFKENPGSLRFKRVIRFQNSINPRKIIRGLRHKHRIFDFTFEN